MDHRPGQAGPSKSCRPATHKFPDSGTIGSNLTGPAPASPRLMEARPSEAACPGLATCAAGLGPRAGCNHNSVSSRRLLPV